MQQLHLVGFTTDHRGLIFSVRRGAKSGGYMIHLDASLVESIDELKALIAEETAAEVQATESRPESSLSVREVQARLRRGRTIEQVAREAGVDPAWVSRFAVPVIAEQAEVVRAARATKMTKLRVGVSGATLGDAVYRNLADRDVTDPRDLLDKAWSARQLTDGAWLVTFKYTSRGRVNEAVWEYDPEVPLLKARGRLGTLLGYREPRRVPRPPTPPAAKATRAAKSTKKAAKATKKKAAAPKKKPATTTRKATTRNARRLAAAREAATKRMVNEAERATKRNAALARKAATKPIVLPPRRFEPPPREPEPEPEPYIVDPLEEELVDVGVVGEEELALEDDVFEDDELDDEELEETEVEEFEEFEDEEPEPEPEPELVAEPEPRPARRAPLRARRREEDSPAGRARERVFARSDAEGAEPNGPVFRTDLASPASEELRRALRAPAEPLVLPEPIERPPRRRRLRPLRGR